MKIKLRLTLTKIVLAIISLCALTAGLSFASINTNKVSATTIHGHAGFTALTQTMVDQVTSLGGAIPDGSYYLSENVTASDNLTVNGDVTICLNGKTLSMDAYNVTITSGATLNIYDCATTGIVQMTTQYIDVSQNATLNLYSGTILGPDGSTYENSVVCNGTFNMYGGNVDGIVGVLVNAGGTATINDGTILATNCGMAGYGTMTLNGGKIKGKELESASKGVVLQGNSGNLFINCANPFENNKIDVYKSDSFDAKINGLGSDFSTTTPITIGAKNLPTTLDTSLTLIVDGASQIDNFTIVKDEADTNNYVLRANASDVAVYLAIPGTLNANGGKWADNSTTQTDYYKNGDIITKPTVIPTKAGYDLKGWALTANGDVIPEEWWTNEMITISQTNNELFAIWELSAPEFDTGDAGHAGTYDKKTYKVGKMATHQLNGTATPISYKVYKYIENAWVEQTSITTPQFNVKNVSDSGKYKVTASITVDSVTKSADLEFNVVINKANAVIKVNNNDIVIIAGRTWSLPVATTNFGTIQCDKTIEDLANAGNYVVTYTVVGTDNYNGDVKTLNVTVKHARLVAHLGDDVTSAPALIVGNSSGFAPNASINVKEVSTENAQKSSLVKPFETVVKTFGISMTLDGVTTQTDGTITIKLLIPKELQEKEFKIIYNYNGEYIQLNYTLDGDYAVFHVAYLSEFSFVQFVFPWWIVLIIGVVIFALIALLPITWAIGKKKKQDETSLEVEKTN